MKIKSKLFVVVALIMSLMLAFAACAKQPTPEDNTPPITPEVFNPSIVGNVATAYFYKDTPADLNYNIRLNTGTFESLSLGATALIRGTDYTFNVGTEILSIKKVAMMSLEVGTYSFKFKTDKGHFDLSLEVKASAVPVGYDITFSMDNPTLAAEKFFTKVVRNAEGATFSFTTLGDFNMDGTEKEFVSVYVDNKDAAGAYQPATGPNWRLGEEDTTFRIYSDGALVQHSDYQYGTYNSNRADGADNTWWKMDWVNSKATNQGKTQDVTVTPNAAAISRANGVTMFSVTLTNSQLGINASDPFKFLLIAASDNSIADFALRADGKMQYDGQNFDTPAHSSSYIEILGDGSLTYIGKGITPVPTSYNIRFATENSDESSDKFYAKVTRDETKITFDFLTQINDFDLKDGKKEFINVYMDLPNASGEFNASAPNWFMNAEDVNIRIYSDGTVVAARYDSGTLGDNFWWKMTWAGTAEDDWAGSTAVRNNVIYSALDISANAVTFNKSNAYGANMFSYAISYADLGISADKDIRFSLKQCADNSNDFALYGGNVIVNGSNYGDTAQASNYANITPDGIVSTLTWVNRIADYNIYFNKGDNALYAKVTRDTVGIKFDFATRYDFGANASECVNILLDLPNADGAFNLGSPNWHLNAEDYNLRIYGDGTTKYRDDLNGAADCIWWKVAEAGSAETAPVVITKGSDGITTFSITFSYADLGISADKDIHFTLGRFWNEGNGNFGIRNAVMAINDISYGEGVNASNYAKITSTGIISRIG